MSIPETFIDDLKTRVDIYDVINSRVTLKKQGSEYTACCPFHEDKTPSFTVNTKDQFFHCFSCLEGGDVVKFLMTYDSLEFPAAIKELAGIAGVEVPEDRPMTPVQKEQAQINKQVRAKLPEVLTSASGFFYGALKDNETAREYFKGRGVTSEIAKRFRLGASVSLLDKGFDQGLLVEAGLIKARDDQSGFYDFFRNRVMFPVRNEKGESVGFGGRVLDDSKPKYLNSSDTKVFDKSKILYGLHESLEAERSPERLIVVEGYMDVVALAQAGINNAVAGMGTAFTSYQAKLVFRFTDEVVFCFDGDEAGARAAKKAVEVVAEYAATGKMVKFLTLPKKQDPDDFVKANGADAFNALVGDAEPLSKAVMRFVLCDDGDQLDLPEIQTAVVSRAKALLSFFPDSVYKESVVKVIAKKVGVNVKALNLPHTPSKLPASQKEGVTLTAEFIQRFKLVEGSTNVFDSSTGSILKKPEFTALVTKENSSAWFDLTDKPTITQNEAYGFDQDNPFDRYVLLHGTMEAWDKTRFDSIPINALRISLGENYKLWENSPLRQQIDHDRLVFDPTGEIDADESYINRFRGIPLTPTDTAECLKNQYANALPIIELLNLLCNDDADAIHWVTCWLAYPLQNIGAKMDTSLLFHGIEEGSGKTLLLSRVMRHIYGDYAGEFGQAQLDSAWNGWQADKLYGVFDEVVSRKDTYSGMGPLKQMVTSDRVMVERKFRESVTEINYMNAVFLSNETLPFPISSRDRRWFVMWPKTQVSRDLSERYSAAERNGGVAEFYRYLLEYPIGDFNERTKPPVTQDKQALIEYGMQGWEVFLRDWAAGDLDVPFKACLANDLCEFYQYWCRDQGMKALPKNKLTLNLKRRMLHHKFRYMEGGIDAGVERQRPFFVPGGREEIEADQVDKTMVHWATFAAVEFRDKMNSAMKTEGAY